MPMVTIEEWPALDMSARMRVILLEQYSFTVYSGNGGAFLSLLLRRWSFLSLRRLRASHLCFGHDEEVGGQAGAARVASLLREYGVRCDLSGPVVAAGGLYAVSYDNDK